MLRTIFLLGLLTVGCMAFGQNYNAEKVDRPNTKKINPNSVIYGGNIMKSLSATSTRKGFTKNFIRSMPVW